MRRRRERTARERESRLQSRVDAAASSLGMRVLRELGEGGTSVVCLVVPRDADPFRPFDGAPAALKVARSEGAENGRVREDRVLAAVRSPHVLALLGTPDAESGSLLLEYLPGGTLADLLARRDFLRVGEAVTILVSVVRALSALHAAGHWHGSLSASKVVFAADGRPVVVGLSHALPVTTGSVPRISGVSARETPNVDDPGFREIVELVAQAVGDPAIEPAAGELAAMTQPSLAEEMDAGSWLRLESRLFEVGRPEPVLLVPLSAPLAHRGNPSFTGDAPKGSVETRDAASIVGRLLHRDAVARFLRAARARRRLLLYSSGCVLVVGALAIALVVVPQGADSRSNVGQPTTIATAQPARPSPEATATVTSAEGGAPEPEASDAAVKDDEPVTAAVRLLRARFECFSSSSPTESCLDDLVEPGSPMESGDRAELHAGVTETSGRSRDFRTHEVSLIERMGDAALLALTPVSDADTPQGRVETKPASLLIVRGEAGWRLRELFEN